MVFDRTQLVCPVTSGGEAAAFYSVAFDNPNGDPMAATGSYQPWWNEDCTGSLKIDDTCHSDDPTIAAPMAKMDFTLEGPIAGGKREIAVRGGTLKVEWTFSRGRRSSGRHGSLRQRTVRDGRALARRARRASVANPTTGAARRSATQPPKTSSWGRTPPCAGDSAFWPGSRRL